MNGKCPTPRTQKTGKSPTLSLGGTLGDILDTSITILFWTNGEMPDENFLLSFQLGKVYGVESYVLSPEETKKLYPLMNVDDLYGTLYSPGDGTLDPASWVSSCSRAATKRGAKVRPRLSLIRCSFFVLILHCLYFQQLDYHWFRTIDSINV